MALDPMIAGGFRGLELQNPLETYARVAQLQQAQQAEQLNALKLQEMRRSTEEQNRLRAVIRPDFDPTNPEHQKEIYRVAPTIAPGFIEKSLATRKTVADIGKARAEAQDKQMRALGIGLSNVLDNPTDEALELAFKTLESTGVDVAPYRFQFSKVTDIGQRKRFITNYVTSHPEGRAALEFVRPKPKEVDVSGKKIFIDENPNSPSFGKEIITGQAVQPFPADVEEQKKRLAAAGKPSVDVKVAAFTPASEAAQKQFMDETAKERAALRNAPDTLANLDRARTLISGAKGFMGTGGDPLLRAASFLNNRLGFTIDTKGVADATELRTRLFDGILDNLKRLDSQPSQEQQRVMQEALGTLGTDPLALPRILDKIEESVRGRVSRYNKDVTDAENRGVKFPYKPQIDIPPPKTGAAPGTPEKTIIKTGTFNGRRVNQYSDGSISYAD